MKNSKLILVVTGVAQVATKFAGMLTNNGLQAKALCPPQGLQGLIGALKSGLSNAEAVLFTPDAFSKPNKVDPVSAIRALLITKPSLRVLVFRTGGMENLHVKDLLKAGAASVYIGNIPSDKEFSSWVEENVFGIPTKQAHIEKKRGNIQTFSIPRSISQEVRDVEENESEGFSLDEQEPPEIGSIAHDLMRSDKSKPNGKEVIARSGLSKSKAIKSVVPEKPVSKPPVFVESKQEVVQSKAKGAWPFPKKQQETNLGESSKEQEGERVQVACPASTQKEPVKPTESSQDVVGLQNQVREYEQVIVGLLAVIEDAEKSNASFVERARELVARLAHKTTTESAAIPSVIENASSPEVSNSQKEIISVTKIGKRHSRVCLFETTIELPNSFAELVKYIGSASKKLTMEDIADEFDIKVSSAHVMVANLKRFLREHYGNLGLYIRNAPNKGYYINRDVSS